MQVNFFSLGKQTVLIYFAFLLVMTFLAIEEECHWSFTKLEKDKDLESNGNSRDSTWIECVVPQKLWCIHFPWGDKSTQTSDIPYLDWMCCFELITWLYFTLCSVTSWTRTKSTWLWFITLSLKKLKSLSLGSTKIIANDIKNLQLSKYWTFQILLTFGRSNLF